MLIYDGVLFNILFLIILIELESKKRNFIYTVKIIEETEGEKDKHSVEIYDTTDI